MIFREASFIIFVKLKIQPIPMNNEMKKIKENLHWMLIVGIAVLVWRWLDYSLDKNFDTLKPVIEGVIGGIVTALILLLFTRLWKSNITPWFEHLTYRDAKIEGVWVGFLVPYIGIEEIDRLRMQTAWRRAINSKKSEKTPEAMPLESTTLAEDGTRSSGVAELILPEKSYSHEQPTNQQPPKKKTITVSLTPPVIRVRAEFWRTGANVHGRLIEIGGASNIHTYYMSGKFRNLILCGSYENENPQNIDRGSFSLMLRSNGAKFEGFFASYADEAHKIHPFRCVLKRMNATENL
jgi:hypothetical protein